MNAVTLAIRYIAFAIAATIGNLLTQRLVIRIGSETLSYFGALLAGTIVGLIIKYLLDKRWIFSDTSRGMVAHGRNFSLYALMGVATTVIFWGSETLFWLIWHNQEARETGAILGLAVGYFVKYRLDRRFVFANGGLAGRTA